MKNTRRLMIVTVSLIGLLATIQAFSLEPGSDELVRLAKNERKVVIADFGLGLCQQCRKQSKILDEIQRDFAGEVVIRRVNVNREGALTRKYRIMQIPTLIFFNPLGEQYFVHIGVMPYEKVSRKLIEPKGDGTR